MTRIAYRAFAFNVLSVLLGCVVFFAGVTAFMPDPLIAPIAAAIAIGALTGAVVLRRQRARWMRAVAIYESYDAFAATAKEQKGVIHDVGRKFLFKGPLSLVGSARRATIREAYHQLQSARRRTAITEPEYRAAIDELLARAADRARL